MPTARSMSAMALAQETDRLTEAEQLTPEPVAPEAAAADATQFIDGPVPAVADTTAQDAATASQLAFDQEYNLDGGLHEWDVYKSACDSGDPQKWKPEYQDGYTSAAAFMKPADHGQPHSFKLQKGQSAGDALTAWVTGLTISDFNAIRMAQDLLELKDDMGWVAFDKMFGSSDMADDAVIPEDHRLIISSQVHQTLWVENMRTLAFADPEPLSEPASLETQPVEEEVAQDKAQAEEQPVVADEMMLTNREREQVG